MSADQLRARVFTLCHLADHTLGELAQEIALHPKVLSRKLNHAGSARLTLAEKKRLILTLARWHALTTRQEALALIDVLDLSPTTFSPVEWATEPLAQLEAPIDLPVLPTEPRQPSPSRSNLPATMTRLIGREQAVEALRHLLQQPDIRLVTLLGPGGTGKTTLALAVARGLVGHWTDGVMFVPLAGVTNPRLVMPTIAQTLGVKDAPNTTLLAQIAASFRAKELLLVLDNCEQVLDAAPEIAELLLEVPGLTVLATSRAPLHLYGEYEWSVAPLDVPNVEHLPLDIDHLRGYTAIQLFTERARAVQAPCTLSSEYLPVIAALCARLDGLPLAIELAAARTKALAPATILQQLMAGRWEVLDSTIRNLPARHQTMDGVIGWSYDLLDSTDQRLFRQLGVFVGGWDVEAARAVWQRDDAAFVLQRFVDQSLVVHQHNASEQVRYRLLEPIRQFALHRLEQQDEGATRTRHARYYVLLAETAMPKLIGPDQHLWFGLLDVEHDNLRAALTWSLTAANDDRPLRLAGALWRFWDVHGYVTEGRRWLEHALSLPVEEYSLARIEALKGAGTLASRQGEYRRAQTYHRAALDLFQRHQDRLGVAHMLNNLGCEALELGDLAYADTVWHESLSLYESFGDQRGIGNVLDNLGELAQGQGDWERARHLHERSMALHHRIGDVRGIAVNLNNLGSVLYELGEYMEAGTAFQESLRLCQELGERGVMARALEGQAMVMGAQGDSTAAARLWGAAAALRDTLGVPVAPSSRAQHDREQRRLREQMDPTAWETAWHTGQTMALDQAVAALLSGLGGRSPSGDQ